MPHVVKSLLDFIQLSKESLDQRDEQEKRMHSYQEQLITSLNPLLLATDRMEAVLKQYFLPALALPASHGELCLQLQLLQGEGARSSDQKALFLNEWGADRMRNELGFNEELITALLSVMVKDSAYTRKKAALQEFQTSVVLQATKRGSIASAFTGDLRSNEEVVRDAASAVEERATHCMFLLPERQWMLLLFVEHLPQQDPESSV
ncbi:hypothetical protein cyc_04388 [Cyclospora cayetanensis]|uniref:Uncharacterized protein n=1 Tax=Cyclospora cayetanensis TaxID=88456 RepID=A0A1D3CSL2_9EIME|nr:hypothetical protein cyc_04388 [Cyclospora cayetanensis]